MSEEQVRRVDLDKAELTVRIAEACHDRHRPQGFTVEQAIDSLHPDTRTMFDRAAGRAIDYFIERLEQSTGIAPLSCTQTRDPILPLAEAAMGTEYAIIGYEEWSEGSSTPVGCAVVRIAGPGTAGRGLPFIVPADNPERELWGRRGRWRSTSRGTSERRQENNGQHERS